jgi:hypothetical protein
MNNGMIVREVDRFRHWFEVTGITVPTPHPISPSTIYRRLLEEL